MTVPRQRWAILGGGVLGMTLALRLRQHGQDVTLFEAAPHFGGLASAWQIDDVVWDRHYHVTLLSDTGLRALLTELGLEQDLTWVETKTGFYTDGQLFSMSNSVEFLRFPPLGFLDKLRLGTTIFYASKLRDWKRLENIPVTDWLRKWSGERTFKKIWLPLLRAKLGDNYTIASAAFIWAIIARMYAARRTGLKKEMFGYVRGGYARILERFAHQLTDSGVSLQPTHAAAVVEPTGEGVRATFLNGYQETFDRVVLTTPATVALKLLPGLNDDEKERLAGVRYQGIVCASLLLKKPLARFYVTNITETWVPFTAVIEMTTLVDPIQFGGRSLIYLPRYVPPDDPTFALSDEEIQSRFLDGLEKMYPHFSRDDVLAFRVSRVKHVFPISTLGYSDRVPAMVTSIPGVHLVNSAQIVNGTLNVNETVQLAERAFRDVLKPAVASPSPAGCPT